MSLRSQLVNTACRLGGLRLAKTLTANIPRILMYHRFSAKEEYRKLSVATFTRQIEILSNEFNVLPLSVVTTARRTGQPLPKHCIALTVDDGYDDFYRFAWPVLKKFRVPATVYITTDFVDRKLWLWPDKVAYIINHTSLPQLTLATADSGRILPLATLADRRAAWIAVNNHCVALGHQARLEFIEQLARDLSVVTGDEPVEEYSAMNWDAIREVAANGIEIGAHSCTHPILSTLDRESLRAEIHGSKTRIEQMLSRPISAFCYPNGDRTDYNELVKQVIRESGFSSATVAFHDKSVWNDMLEIRRYSVGDDLIHFLKVIHGVETLSDRLA